MERKEKLQCVLIAAEYTKSFFPFNLHSLNVVNVPILEYSLEILNRNGFEEVIVFCEKDGGVKNFINDGIFEKRSWSVDMNIQVITLEECIHMNQALSDLYSRGIVRGNFILMEANTITNMNLLSLLETHKKNYANDKNAVMTVVYSNSSANHKTGEEVVLVSDKQTRRLLYHKKIGNSDCKRIKLPLDIFFSNSDVILHHDLMDPQIVVCSNAALTLFVDNYDYTNLDIFIQGVLENEELLGSHIYMSELSNNMFALKIQNWQSYQFVCQDIMNRWMYPLVPNNGISKLSQKLNFHRNIIYTNKNSCFENLSNSSNILIDEGTIVGAKTILENAIIGKNCFIGENCKLSNVFVFDGTRIENNIECDCVVIGHGVKIGQNSLIGQGTIIGNNCIIPQNATLLNAIIVETDLLETEWSLSYQKISEKAFRVIDNSNNLDTQDIPDDDNSELEFTPFVSIKMSKLTYCCASSTYSSSNNGDDDNDSLEDSGDEIYNFQQEISESMKRAFDVEMEIQNLLVEINGSRFAHNVSLSEVNFHVVRAMFTTSTQQITENTVLSRISKLFKYFYPVLKNYIKGPNEMRDCLRALELSFKEQPLLLAKAGEILHFFYDKEVISEEVITNWYIELDEELKSKSLKQLIAWLEQASEEESD